MVMIFAGGHVSGGHFNPAVTLAAFLRGRCDKKDVLPYFIAQFAAGFVAATVALHALGMLAGLATRRLSPPVMLRYAGAAIAVTGVAMALLPN